MCVRCEGWADWWVGNREAGREGVCEKMQQLENLQVSWVRAAWGGWIGGREDAWMVGGCCRPCCFDCPREFVQDQLPIVLEEEPLRLVQKG